MGMVMMIYVSKVNKICDSFLCYKKMIIGKYAIIFKRYTTSHSLGAQICHLMCCIHTTDDVML